LSTHTSHFSTLMRFWRGAEGQRARGASTAFARRRHPAALLYRRVKTKKESKQGVFLFSFFNEENSSSTLWFTASTWTVSHQLYCLFVHGVDDRRGTRSFLAAGGTFLTVANCLEHVLLFFFLRCVLFALIIIFRGISPTSRREIVPFLLQRPFLFAHNNQDAKITGLELFPPDALFLSSCFYWDKFCLLDSVGVLCARTHVSELQAEASGLKGATLPQAAEGWSPNSDTCKIQMYSLKNGAEQSVSHEPGCCSYFKPLGGKMRSRLFLLVFLCTYEPKCSFLFLGLYPVYLLILSVSS